MELEEDDLGEFGFTLKEEKKKKKDKRKSKAEKKKEEKVKEEEEELWLSWMWADAQIAPGMSWAAHINPFRWGSGTVEEVQNQLSKYQDKQRPVKLHVKGYEKRIHRFPSPSEALEFIEAGTSKDAVTSLHGDYVLPSKSLFLSFAMTFLSVPALALYLRVATAGEEERGWTQRNLFVAWSYAALVTKFPKDVVKFQAGKSRFVRQRVSWEEFPSFPESKLASWISIAQMLESDRPATTMFEGVEWERHAERNDFWVVYTSGEEAVLAIRGGDKGGRPDDMKKHSGSPVRAFVEGDDEYRVPVEILPFQVVEAVKDKALTVVAYSQGAIACLACSYHFGAILAAVSSIKKMVIFNGAFLFWPMWLGVGDSEHLPIQSFVVEGDPLSDPGQGAPQAPGTTYLLPTRGKGFNNHYLHHFQFLEPLD
jgi:hypothetical protein